TSTSPRSGDGVSISSTFKPSSCSRTASTSLLLLPPVALRSSGDRILPSTTLLLGGVACASILSPERIFDLSETSNFDPSLQEKGPTKISTAYPTSSVAISDYEGWSLYGAPWLQPVAISGKSTERGNGGTRQNRCRGLRP